MTLIEIYAALNAGRSVVAIGTAIAKVRSWLMGLADSEIDPNLRTALDRLPPHATADDIVRVVSPFMNSVGGDISLSAGHDGGGNLQITDTTIEAGSGVSKGGNVLINAGDGGPHGKGGDSTITGSTIKAGDAR